MKNLQLNIEQRTRGRDTTSTIMINFSQQQVDFLEQGYQALRQSVYDSLILQTRLKPYLDAVNLQVSENGITLDFSAVEAANDAEWRVWG